MNGSDYHHDDVLGWVFGLTYLPRGFVRVMLAVNGSSAITFWKVICLGARNAALTGAAEEDMCLYVCMLERGEGKDDDDIDDEVGDDEGLIKANEIMCNRLVYPESIIT